MELIDKSDVVAEINRVLNSYDPNEITSGRYALVNLRNFLDTIEVKEVDLDEEIDSWVNDLHTVPTFEELDKFARHFFELGLNAKVADANLWKSADGDDLPEIDREVVVFTQKEGLSPKVGIAHRPDPKGWDGKNISTGEIEHYEPKTYGKGGWSLPDVKIWLDTPLPFKEGGEE